MQRELCAGCGARLMSEPHHPTCPKRPVDPWDRGEPWRVRRMALSPAMRRFEEQLEECNRRAYAAWLKSGRGI